MKAIQVVALTGPSSALRLVELPETEPSHMLTPGEGVLIDVRAAGVSFPEVLQTRGEYQLKPPCRSSPAARWLESSSRRPLERRATGKVIIDVGE